MANALQEIRLSATIFMVVDDYQRPLSATIFMNAESLSPIVISDHTLYGC